MNLNLSAGHHVTAGDHPNQAEHQIPIQAGPGDTGTLSKYWLLGEILKLHEVINTVDTKYADVASIFLTHSLTRNHNHVESNSKYCRNHFYDLWFWLVNDEHVTL